MREWRSRTVLSVDQRARATARAYAHVYLKRGKLTRQPCACGSTAVQMHHLDYDRPLDVVWTCRPCHLATHGKRPASIA